MSKHPNHQTNKDLVNNQDKLEKQVNYPKIEGDLKMEGAPASHSTNNIMLKSNSMAYALVMIVALLLFAFLYLSNKSKDTPKIQAKLDDAIQNGDDNNHLQSITTIICDRGKKMEINPLKRLQ